MPRSVAVVFETDYADELERLAFRAPVWLIDTPANRMAADHVMLSAVEWPHISVTLFRVEDGWPALLGQIAMREKFDTMEIIGATLTEPVRESLVAAGFERFEETRDGFRARMGWREGSY